MVLFQLITLTLNFISIEVACDLALNSLWLPYESDSHTAMLLLRAEEKTTTDPQLPIHHFPEEQLASSTEMMETNYTAVDLKKLLEDSKKVGPLWKYRYANSSEEAGDPIQPEAMSNSNQSEKKENNKVGPISKESNDQGITASEPTSRDIVMLQDQLKLKTVDPKDVIDSNKMSSIERRRYAAEIEAGDLTQLVGVSHIYQPKYYRSKDLGVGYLPQLFRYDKNLT